MGLKFGSVTVPIIDTIELTGSPASKPFGDVSNALFAHGFDNEDLFAAGTSIGMKYSNRRTPGSTSDPQYTRSYVQSGRTSLGDSVDFVLTVHVTAEDPYNADNNTYTASSKVYREAVSIDGENTLIVESLFPSSTASSVTEVTTAFAVRYKYPEASTEKGQRYGYFIGFARANTTVTASGASSTSYTFDPSGFWFNIPYLNEVGGYDCFYLEEGEDPFDPSEPSPYTPSGDDSSDEIDLPDDPDIGVTNAGFINVYKPSAGALSGLGEILFPNVATATDIVDAVLKLCMVISNQNLINYVIDCHVIPCTPTAPMNAEIKVGYINTGISVPKVTSDYCNVSCGSLNIGEFFGGFLDYGAFTAAKLYLPFIGFVDTKPEFFQSGTISVDYKFNVIDGSFMAYVRSSSSKSKLTSSVIAQYSGNACMHFPLTGVNYSAMVSGVVGGVTSVAAAKTPTAALGKAFSAANSLMASPSVQQSNGYNSTSAILGVRTPYLMIERPSPAYPSGYAHNQGYPSNITTTLSNVRGYTEIDDIDLSGIPLTQGELEELRQLLADGVYF